MVFPKLFGGVFAGYAGEDFLAACVGRRLAECAD